MHIYIQNRSRKNHWNECTRQYSNFPDGQTDLELQKARPKMPEQSYSSVARDQCLGLTLGGSEVECYFGTKSSAQISEQRHLCCLLQKRRVKQTKHIHILQNCRRKSSKQWLRDPRELHESAPFQRNTSVFAVQIPSETAGEHGLEIWAGQQSHCLTLFG